MEMARGNIGEAARAIGLIDDGPQPWERDDYFGPSCQWPRPARKHVPMILAYEAERQWVALSVAANRERKVAEWLRDSGHPVYFPNWIKMVRSRGGQRRAVVMSIIPGYLFLAKSPGFELRSLMERVPGLLGYLHDGDLNPLALTEAGIQGIRLIEADMNRPEPDRRSAHEYKTGDAVKTVDDLNLGWKGKIVELASDNRIGVEVKLLGRTVKVYVSSAQIVPDTAKGSQATPGQVGRRR